MKERLDLTSGGPTPYPRVRGNLFMDENQGEIPKSGAPEPLKTPEVPTLPQQASKLPREREVPPEAQAKAREAWKKFTKGEPLTPKQESLARQGIRPVAGRQETGEQRPLIFEGIEPPTLTEEQRGAMSGEEQRLFETQVASLRPYIEAIRRADETGFLNSGEAYNNLNEAVRRGEVDLVLAQPYFEALATRGREAATESFLRQLSEDRANVLRIRQIIDRQQRLTALKQITRHLSPDLRPIDQELLGLIAEDEEVSEIFLDKIISKPFAAPEADYRLGFYADINLQAFYTEVKVSTINGERHVQYVRKSETALRFHQMNKTIISESGNIDGFLAVARTVTPQHIQSATQEDGVERMRQLLEIAFGRLYTETNRVTGDNFDPKIIEWTSRQFRKEAAEGAIKSKFLGPNGEPRNLEDWEIEKAIALGRNIVASFYRFSELISWSNVPPEWEEWLKSIPTETVVRVLAGFKWLTHRFRIGNMQGGPELISLLYDKIKKGIKTGLKKIGKLSIRDDLVPVGFFKARGFDWGWRALAAYLDNETMQIIIPSLDYFPEEMRGDIEEFIRERGIGTSLGRFLFKQEYVAQLLASEKAKIAGVEIREELRKFSETKQTELVEQLLLPLLGYIPVEREGPDTIKMKVNGKETYYKYESGLDQIHLSLGVLISFGALTENVRTILWQKVANYLPLRIAYFLSEEGVKSLLPEYNSFRGEGENLFNEEFENKLIKVQHLRFQAQKINPRRKVELEVFFEQAGLTNEERQFIRRLQQLGKEKAGELAKISFPDISFMEDVPFREANYITLAGEVFPRRVGSDFRGYSETNAAFNSLTGNLGQPYEKVLEHLSHLVGSLSGPEGIPTAQNVALPILQSYLEIIKQWELTKIPFIKTILNLVGLPASHMQRIFTANAPAADESELNMKARAAVEQGIIRREKLPDENKGSQLDQILKEVGGKWYNVLWREIRNVLVVYLLLMSLEFFKKTATEKA